MTRKRLLLACAVLAALAGAAYVSQDDPGAAGVRMADAATRLLESFTPEQKAQGTFAFEDRERTNWHFVPLQGPDRKATRKGLPLERMDARQKALARELVRAGTSGDGYRKALAIMSLEVILRDLEKGGAMVRNPEWYFFSIFGAPSRTGRWGWRVEGHHLSRK